MNPFRRGVRGRKADAETIGEGLHVAIMATSDDKKARKRVSI
jgi:hypothetical protein